MKKNLITKLVWFAACVVVLFSVENVARADESATPPANSQQAKTGHD